MKPFRHPYHDVGRFIYWKYRRMAKARGIPYAEQRMRRDGMPPLLRALILSAEGYSPPPEEEPEPPTPRAWYLRLVSFLTTP